MKKFFYLITGMLVTIAWLMAITNPTTQDLKNSKKRPAHDKVTFERKNYVIFSTYHESGTDGFEFYDNEYIGVLGKFFVISKAVT